MTVPLPTDRAGHQTLHRLVDEIVAHSSKNLPEQEVARWREDLDARLQRVHQHPEQNMGFIEEHVRQSALELQRLIVEKAMQIKADAVEDKCPDCQHPLRDKKRRVERTVDAYCGKVKLVRTHGY